MKNVMKNKKGFTLIELLAVIVILAILVMVAIPAVTTYLRTSRNSAFIDNAKIAVDAVRNNYIITGSGGKACGTSLGGGVCYDKDAINALLEKKLNDSPFGGSYTDACVQVLDNSNYNDITTGSDVTYKVCLIDGKGNGFALTEVNSIEAVGTVAASTTCGCPA